MSQSEADLDGLLAQPYTDGFSLEDLFVEKSAGMVAPDDYVMVDDPAPDWLKPGAEHQTFQIITHRPFDHRVAHLRVRQESRVMRHMRHPNIGLCYALGIGGDRPFTDAFVFSTNVVDRHCLSPDEVTRFAPLYLFEEDDDSIEPIGRTNFDVYIHQRLGVLTDGYYGLFPRATKILEYVYGVLNWPQYRTVHAENLKTGSPRIPWPTNRATFVHLSVRGSIIFKIHNMEMQTDGGTLSQLRGDGDNVVEDPRFEDGSIWINRTQWFDRVPTVAWDVWIGAYQPARQWLTARTGRPLRADEVKHFQRVLKEIADTDRLMRMY